MNDAIEAHWPVIINGTPIAYSSLSENVQIGLSQAGLPLTGFSHFALVVADIRAALNALSELDDAAWKTAEVVWGKAFGCHASRRCLVGGELEVLQPVNPGFLLDALRERGDGLQHLCFNVANVEESMRALEAKGEHMMDGRVYGGLHGCIAFVKPGRICPVYLELCESH